MKSSKYFLIFIIFLSVIGLIVNHVSSNTQLWETKTINRKINLLNGQWKYMPGASFELGKLKIQDSKFSIVSRNGTNDQSNPPLNLFGTRLSKVNDFAIEATMESIEGEASLWLYGRIPLIQDEFRIDGPNLRITVNANTLKVATPTTTQSYIFVVQPIERLRVTQIDNTLSFYLNDEKLGDIKNENIFNLGEVWFGADSYSGSWLLSGLEVEPLNSDKLDVIDLSTLLVSRDDQSGFQFLAEKKRPDFLIGAAMALGPMVSDSSYSKNALNGNFGLMTIENALKWQFVEPREGHYDYHEADALVTLAQRHSMAIHGHTLVFGEANPAWVRDLPVATITDKKRIKEVMKTHITNVMGHYKGRISTWDIVNEPMADYSSFSEDTPLRQHKWYQAMGENYIAEAFKTARLADPQAKLFINDYGLEEDGERWDAFVDLINQLKTLSVPIDGVGFQTHIYSSKDYVDKAVLRRHIRQIASLGLVVRISETDVHSDRGTIVQAQQYADIFYSCFIEPSCISWTTWGISDRYNIFMNDEGKLEYGKDLLWDFNMRPSPAIHKIKQVLKGR
jgi:endo-1,4-beta-xylanase